MKAILTLIFCFATLTQVATATSRISNYTKDKIANDLASQQLSVGDDVLIRVFKFDKSLQVWMRPSGTDEPFRVIKDYAVCKYSGTLGPKERVGDKQAPEGFYEITADNLNYQSRYHLSMDIGYPNTFDQSLGRTGSLIMIHGSCDSVGCFAMGNAQIEEIFYLVEQALQSGQSAVQVHVFPFHFDASQSAIILQSEWLNFWQNIRQGYERFNATKQPLNISVNSGKYEYN